MISVFKTGDIEVIARAVTCYIFREIKALFPLEYTYETLVHVTVFAEWSKQQTLRDRKSFSDAEDNNFIHEKDKLTSPEKFNAIALSRTVLFRVYISI